MPGHAGHAPLSHALMFWLLAGMGVATAVPCFVAQPIDAYRRLLQAERREEKTVQRLEDLAARQAALSEGLRRDPQVNIRLAQRELGYRAPGRFAPVAASRDVQPVRETASLDEAMPVELPAWMAQLYPGRFSSVYRDERARYLVLFLSLTLILFALVTYARRGFSANPSRTVAHPS